MELFVDDLDAGVAFYTGVLGFEVTRGSEDYVSLRRDLVDFGYLRRDRAGGKYMLMA